MRLGVALFSALLITGCAGAGSSADGPETAGKVNLERYQGTWYEQARLPMFFQRNCVRSQANYRLQDDGSVAVTNRCETEDGEQQEESRLERAFMKAMRSGKVKPSLHSLPPPSRCAVCAHML